MTSPGFNVISIVKSDPSSSTGTEHIVAVAIDENAALAWIVEETKKSSYAQNHPPEYWMTEWPMFRFETIPVHQGFYHKEQ